MSSGRPTTARFTVGDPLRAFAALGVFGLHAAGAAVTESGYVELLSADPTRRYADLYGVFGHAINGLEACVALFFVLSGYLLSRPFLRTFFDGDPLPSIPGYLRNRALRILPAFWVVFALTLVFFGSKGDALGHTLGQAVFLASFKDSGLHAVFGQAWSLGVEVRFYLFLPFAGVALWLLARALGPRLPRWARIVLVLVLVAVGYDLSQAHAPTDGPFYESFATNAYFFAPGICLAALEHVLPPHLRGRRSVLIAAPVLFVVGLGLMLFSLHLRFKVAPSWFGDDITPLGTGLIVAGPLLWQWSGRPAWWLLDNRLLQWLGTISYPIFLVHTLIIAGLAPLVATQGYNDSLLFVVALTLPLTLLASELIHRFVELPALRLRARARTATPPAPAEAPAEPVDVLAGLGASATKP